VQSFGRKIEGKRAGSGIAESPAARSEKESERSRKAARGGTIAARSGCGWDLKRARSSGGREQVVGTDSQEVPVPAIGRCEGRESLRIFALVSAECC
jgi:hypothetical protein